MQHLRVAPANVANKRLTEKVNPLDATLTKNRGVHPQPLSASIHFLFHWPELANSTCPDLIGKIPALPGLAGYLFQRFPFNIQLSIGAPTQLRSEDPGPVGTVNLLCSAPPPG